MAVIQEKGCVSFVQAVKDFFNGYIDFKGKSTRAGYWWMILAVWLVELLFAFGLLSALEFIPTSVSQLPAALASIFMTLLVVVWFVCLIPLVSLFVRRMRDVGLTSQGMVILIMVYLAADWTLFAHRSALLTFVTIFLLLGSFILTLLPSNQLTTTSRHRLLLFFFRPKN